MPSKLEQLKKEIQRLRPEIMELKFGCEVIVDIEDLPTFKDYLGKEFDGDKKLKCLVTDYDKGGYNGEDYDGDHLRFFIIDWEMYNELDCCNFEDKKDEYYVKILGRPITLEDVLFCCVEAYSKFGIITKKYYEEMLGGVVGLWDFTKDFDNQKEEFYDEIMFLLQ